MNGKGSADTRTPNRSAREATWERVWGEKRNPALEAWKTRVAEDGPCCLQEALRRAGEPVEILLSTETGEPRWVVSLEDAFWMDAFDTLEEAEEFVKAVGWPLIKTKEK